MSAITADLAASIFAEEDFLSAAVLVATTDGDFNEHGIYEPGSEVRTAVKVIVQPLVGAERLALDEGQRERKVFTFWLQVPVAVSDCIEFNQEGYDVFQVRDWNGNFAECLAVSTGAI